MHLTSPARQAGLGALALVIAAVTVMGAPAETATAGLSTTLVRHAFTVAFGSRAYTLDYWANGEIGRADPTVERAIVMVHGDSRNADDYARYTATAAEAAGLGASTMVVAPRFVAGVDDPRDDQLYWTEDSWKEGGESEAGGRAWTISSFLVMDAVLTALRSDYPDARIVLAGHSAGGQFVQRYAASNGVRVADGYVTMNPGSYLYLDPRRWSQGKLRDLAPEEIGACPGYNDYKYGLHDRPTSIFSSTDGMVVSTYLAAPVTYLLGDADTARDSSLDTSCPADWEGGNRLQRGTRFFAALSVIAGGGLGHRRVIVPGVAHDGNAMINSPRAAGPLFGFGAVGTR